MTNPYGPPRQFRRFFNVYYFLLINRSVDNLKLVQLQLAIRLAEPAPHRFRTLLCNQFAQEEIGGARVHGKLKVYADVFVH